jgi:hypothetical protein
MIIGILRRMVEIGGMNKRDVHSVVPRIAVSWCQRQQSFRPPACAGGHSAYSGVTLSSR